MIEQNELERRLMLHEGIQLMPYKCPAGFLTIGIGHNLDANPLNSQEVKVLGDWKKGITKNAALYLLRRDVYKIELELCKKLRFWQALDDERQYALIDMAFNLGVVGLLKFRRMLAAMEIGDYRGAAKECLNSKYAKDVGVRARRIARTIETGEFKYDV